jgi:hypothetical protein
MNDLSKGKSEMARLLWSIEQNCEAMQRVMRDPGFSSSHEAIRKRYTALGLREERLATIVGKEEATHMMCNIYNEVMNRPETEAENRPAQNKPQDGQA